MKKKSKICIYTFVILICFLIQQSSCTKDKADPETNEVTGTFTDSRSSQTYKTIKIGNQTWFAENLNYETANSWLHANSTSGAIYGRLYNWDAALTACPSGWHLPSDAEWTDLGTFLGGSLIAGGKMKETGETHWKTPNTGATNSSGFAALGGGGRFAYGNYLLLTESAHFWSSTEHASSTAWETYINFDSEQLARTSVSRWDYGFSVRCLKD